VSLAEVPLLVVLAGLIAYVVLAGADFGAGFWQLTPGQGEREQAVRAYARDAIRPVWEANHVWLILVLTVTWTCYPGAFAAIASSLAAPLTLAALGIVLRAIGYVVGGEADSPRGNRVLELTFALSSILVPFMLGAAVGGIASGRVPPGNARGDLITSWLNPTSIAIGAVAVATTAYISAVWLTADSSRDDRADLVESFRTRALGSAIVTGLIAFASLIVVRSDDGHLWHGLTRWPGIAAVLVSAIAGAGALGLVARAAPRAPSRPHDLPGGCQPGDAGCDAPRAGGRVLDLDPVTRHPVPHGPAGNVQRGGAAAAGGRKRARVHGSAAPGVARRRRARGWHARAGRRRCGLVDRDRGWTAPLRRRLRLRPRGSLARAHRLSADALLARVAAGDERAFSRLCDLFAGPVLGEALRHLSDRAAAEDVTQEVFLRIWRNAHRFDAERGRAEAWIATIARNASRDALRRRGSLPVEELADAVDPAPDPVDEVADASQALQLQAAVASLAPGSREVIELAYWQGLSQVEIAERLGLPLGTVKTRTRRGLALLADVLEGEI
jgi:RNA polymerase sigma factor (sigma-70 family)